MKRLVVFLMVGLFLSITLSAEATDILGGKTVATVNLTKMEAITEGEVDKKLNQLKNIGNRSGIPEDQINKKNVIESLIDKTLINQAAERDGITVQDQMVNRMIEDQIRSYQQQSGQTVSKEEFKEIVKSETGYEWETYTEQIREQLIQRNYITQKKQDMFNNIDPPSEKQIEEQYRDNKTQFTNPEYVRISHVFKTKEGKNQEEVQKDREKLKKALNEYRSGAKTFRDIVHEYSEDKNSKLEGGDVGYITRDNSRIKQAYGRNFFSSIFEIEEGDVSEIIESNVGLHIVKVTEHEPARILELNDPISPDSQTTLRDYLRRVMYQQKQQQVFQKAMDELITELREEAEIVRYNE